MEFNVINNCDDSCSCHTSININISVVLRAEFHNLLPIVALRWNVKRSALIHPEKEKITIISICTVFICFCTHNNVPSNKILLKIKKLTYINLNKNPLTSGGLHVSYYTNDTFLALLLHLLASFSASLRNMEGRVIPMKPFCLSHY